MVEVIRRDSLECPAYLVPSTGSGQAPAMSKMSRTSYKWDHDQFHHQFPQSIPGIALLADVLATTVRLIMEKMAITWGGEGPE